MTNDASTVDPDRNQGLRARNTNINEDLGKLEYVFSDKTGTLTANEMRLRQISIKGCVYGDKSFVLEAHDPYDERTALRRFDPRLSEAAEKLQAKG